MDEGSTRDIWNFVVTRARKHAGCGRGATKEEKIEEKRREKREREKRREERAQQREKEAEKDSGLELKREGRRTAGENKRRSGKAWRETRNTLYPGKR